MAPDVNVVKKAFPPTSADTRPHTTRGTSSVAQSSAVGTPASVDLFARDAYGNACAFDPNDYSVKVCITRTLTRTRTLP